MQLLGFEVDAINTVQFACRTGHKVVTGQVLNASDLKTVFEHHLASGLS